MASEKELLDRLIKERLGKGKAKFEVGVGRKQIDMVFEQENEIWLVEAKKSLNCEALGQVLTYEKLYQGQFPPKKTLKLGIVCEVGDSAIEEACRSKGVKVFILPEKEAKEEKIEGALICGVCGSPMIEKEGKYKCETCEHFFGKSGIAKQCANPNCRKKYGSFPAVEEEIYELCQLRLAVTKRREERLSDKEKWLNYCPKCRVEELYAVHEGTYCGQMGRMLNEGREIRVRLESQLERRLKFGKAKEFVAYCLKEVKFYFEKANNV